MLHLNQAGIINTVAFSINLLRTHECKQTWTILLLLTINPFHSWSWLLIWFHWRQMANWLAHIAHTLFVCVSVCVCVCKVQIESNDLSPFHLAMVLMMMFHYFAQCFINVPFTKRVFPYHTNIHTHKFADATVGHGRLKNVCQ